MCSKFCPCQVSARASYVGTEYADNVFDSGAGGVPVTDKFLMDCYDQAKTQYKFEFEPDAKVLEIVNYMEESFECSGITTVPNFYVTRSHMEGPPKESCGDSVSQTAGDTIMMVGIIMLVNSFLNFLVFNIQYGYWCKKSEKEIQKEQLEKKRKSDQAERERLQ